MNNRPITEDDLHAYVDDVLEPERRAEVGSYLADHPDVAKRVAGFADQRELLRAALAPIADEPLPPELNLSRIVEGRRRRSPPAWWAIAAMLLLSVGGFGGWVMRGSLGAPPGGLAALAQEAPSSIDTIKRIVTRALIEAHSTNGGLTHPCHESTNSKCALESCSGSAWQSAPGQSLGLRPSPRPRANRERLRRFTSS